VLCGAAASQGRSGSAATVMLDNPAVKAGGLTGAQLLEQVQCLFGLRGVKMCVYTDSAMKQPLKPDAKVTSKQTLYAAPAASQCDVCSVSPVDRPVCHWVNVSHGKVKGTLVLENPRGDVLSLGQLEAQARAVLGLSRPVQLSISEAKSGQLTSRTTASPAQVLSLHGKSLTVL